MAWISCSYILFHRGTFINQGSMERQRNQKLWEWKLTKVSGDSLKLAQGCTSICWQEHLIIPSELNHKTSQLWSWYLNCAYSHHLLVHLHELGKVTAIVHLQLLSGRVIYHTETWNKNTSYFPQHWISPPWLLPAQAGQHMQCQTCLHMQVSSWFPVVIFY